MALAKIPMLGLVLGLLTGMSMVPPALTLAPMATSVASVWEAIDSELPIEPSPQRSYILDRHGKQFATFYSENRINLADDQISQHMKDAQVSIEDTRFFERAAAIDLRALVRAAVGNVAKGGVASGGSTLEQQFVKNVLLNNADTDEEREAAVERSISRKVQEMRLAIGVGQKMTKDEILLAYLNIANYGDGAFGIGAASQHYFGIPASELNIAQSATLAGIVQNPSRNPVSNPERATSRRDVALWAMLEAKRITRDEFDEAKASPLALNLTKPANGCAKSEFPYYCEQVRRVLRTDPAFGATEAERERTIFRGGMTIKTALDPEAMRAATETATSMLGTDNQFAAGIAVVQPGTGHVLALGQNRTFDQTQVSMPTSGYQNGSTFKPITLAAALEDGWDIASQLDAPASITKAGKKFTNQSSTGIGRMNAADALAVSSNTFFVKLSTEVTTVAKTQEMARRLGVPIPDSATGNEASTTLGVYDASPVQTANAYATFAAHGVYCTPVYVTSVSGPFGTVEPGNTCHQELEPGLADTVANALTTVVDGANPRRTGAAMSIGRPTMGKTGTTTGNSSVWFAGGTPQAATAVWIGDPRGGFKYPVNRLKVNGKWLSGVYGSTAAGPIWSQVMKRVHEGLPVENFGTPSTVKQSIVIPDVRGLDVSSAITVLDDAGVTVAVKGETVGQRRPGVVVEQSPEPGSPLSRSGAEVELKLSDGSSTFVVVEPSS